MVYQLLDSGDGSKLEQFGPYILSRPYAPAVWKKQHPNLWKKAHSTFTRADGSRWSGDHTLPEQWDIELSGVKMKVSTTDFGHLGIFPEHSYFWDWMREKLRTFSVERGKQAQVLNLFAYSGGATIAAAQAGASVCHLDASKGMVQWARENAAKNFKNDVPIRWITDDVVKFLRREQKRQRIYDAIIIDPPTFGRGAKGEVFQIENHIVPLLELCVDVLSSEPLFFLFSCHTPGFTPVILNNLVQDAMGSKNGVVDHGEMLLVGNDIHSLPSGSFCRWQHA